MIWCCPTHGGSLQSADRVFRADCCEASFPTVEGIPDLRVPRAAWVDFTADLEAARQLSVTVPADDVAGSVHAVFARRVGWTRERVTRRTRMTMEMAARMRDEWHDWLAPAGNHAGPLLDLGCGPGSLLSVAPVGVAKIGIDASMEWLVVAQRICAAAGVPVNFAAALGEALPLRTGSVGAVCALDVLEHVGDQGAVVREIDRVLQPGGIFCGATPNRFSFGAEPHVGVWGVGWLPRAAQGRYVRWRTGLNYDFNVLLSHRELTTLFQNHASFIPRVMPAPIPAGEIRSFGARRRLLAQIYNRLLRLGPFRAVARTFGPFFHLVGVKRGAE